MSDNDLMSYLQAAEFLGMPIGSLYGLVSKRQIPHMRINKRIIRFSKAELLKFLEAHAVPPGEELSSNKGGVAK